MKLVLKARFQDMQTFAIYNIFKLIYLNNYEIEINFTLLL
jgi:hypothetical protein